MAGVSKDYDELFLKRLRDPDDAAACVREYLLDDGGPEEKRALLTDLLICIGRAHDLDLVPRDAVVNYMRAEIRRLDRAGAWGTVATLRTMLTHMTQLKAPCCSRAVSSATAEEDR